MARLNTAGWKKCNLRKILFRQATRRHIPGQNYIHRGIQEQIESGGTCNRSVSTDKDCVMAELCAVRAGGWEENGVMVLRKILGPKGRKLRNKELLYQILLA